MAIKVAPSVEIRRKLTPEDVEEMSRNGELEDRICELVNGELLDLPPAGLGHGSVSVDITTTLNNFARRHGGRVFDSFDGVPSGTEPSGRSVS